MSNRNREIGIDWIKTVAIILVIFSHCDWTVEERKQIIFPFFIEMAVPLFMIVTGYNYYNSYCIGVLTPWKQIKNNCTRILRPLVFVLFLEIILMLVREYPLKTIFEIVFLGRWAPGAYYISVIIQIILMYPFIYKIIKYDGGVLTVVFSNLCFEVIVAVVDMDPEIYRMLSFRYLSFLAMGSQYAKMKNFISYSMKCTIALFSLCIGIINGYFLNYSDIKIMLFRQWTVTSMPTSFLALAYFLLLMAICVKKCKLIELISKSSFHIFLIQMVYYLIFVKDVHAHFKLNSEYGYFLVNLIICVASGVIFYIVEQKCIIYFRRLIL